MTKDQAERFVSAIGQFSDTRLSFKDRHNGYEFAVTILLDVFPEPPPAAPLPATWCAECGGSVAENAPRAVLSGKDFCWICARAKGLIKPAGIDHRTP